MSLKLRIICFDIDNEEKEKEKEKDKEKNKEDIIVLESPLTILDLFIDIHLFVESEKIEKNNSETKYTFNFNIQKEDKIIYDIYVIKNLDYIHDCSLDADAYLIFLNLESNKTVEKIDKMIKYIMQSYYAKEIKIYLVGIYKDTILPNLNEETLLSYFEDEKLECEYYQIKHKNDKIKHKCLYDEKTIKQINPNKKKTKEKDNIIDIIEVIMMQMYEIKNLKDRNSTITKTTSSKYGNDGKSLCKSANNCGIF